MKTQLTTIQATDAPPEYYDLLALVLEMKVTVGAVASFITTRESASPMADNWIKERLEYTKLCIDAANQKIS
ncbi:hypothetical protein [Nostoc sp. FACHB-110]|uniref:hypothetical protein n=1 Tax=Nostoc sp. FACHB-110 TaxID=2692834 RepID=UPI0016843D12|nr:hypothetical protein [Nostoc sp. FACHB-110]MBD2437386.1 hypothetical protein [Nostoc sp. FACHB-110]